MIQRSFALLLLVAACSAPGTAEPPITAAGTPAANATDTAELVRRYTRDLESIERFYSIATSATRLDRLDRFAVEWRERLAAVDFDALPREGQVDWLLLANHVGRGEDERRAARARIEEMRPLLPFMDEIAALEEARWELAEVDPRAAAGRLAALAEEIALLQERAERADGEAENEEADEAGEDALGVTPVIANRAAKTLGGLRRALDAWFRHYDGYRPDFAWWARDPYGELDEALGGYERHLRRDVAGLKGEDDDPLIGDPLGRDALVAAIRRELMVYGPEELLAVGERELAWVEAEMARAAAELGFEDWRAALEHVKGLHVAPGEQDALVLAQARHAIDFVEELVTIEPLCRETWRLDMMPPETQRTLPYAYYGGQRMVVAYPTDEMDHESKVMSLRGNNEHFSRIVTPHELIPGHHLQGYMAQRYAAHRRPFRTPFLVEGWCLHWEMLLWDLDYARGPEDRIGMLFWRAHRCARIVVSLKFHLGEMTPAEMIDYLVDRVGHERDGATAEVRRYVGDSYGPLYQCGYMIGGLQVRALYRELVTDGGMEPRTFHDAVLRVGSIPIELVRASLVDVPLSPGWEPRWGFAGD